MLSHPIDTGSSPRRWPLYLAAAAIGLGLVVAGSLPNFMRQRAADIAEAKAWDIKGAPCPELPFSEAARQPTATRAFGYAGASFAYAYGHVACAEIHADGGRSLLKGFPVCQFTSPGVIAVDTAGVTTLFAPGLGERATVSVQDGAPRCVMASKFRGQLNF